MKKTNALVLVLAAAFFIGQPSMKVMAEESKYAQVTSDPVLTKALDLLDGTKGEWAKRAILGSNLTKKPIKVVFKNLGELNPAYHNYDALGWKDNGRLTIYINEKHKTAPPEAIACILCHEAVHQDEQSSIAEETYAWGLEADEWIQLKKTNPELSSLNPNKIPLVYRLTTLEKLYISASYSTKLIYNIVSSNPGYQGLPEHSPGF